MLPHELVYGLCEPHRSLAQLCALQGHHDAAVELFVRAREGLDPHGARPLRALVDCDEALMYVHRGAAGDYERARPLLENAPVQLRDIGMPGWIRCAEHMARHGREWTPAEQSAAGNGTREGAEGAGEEVGRGAPFRTQDPRAASSVLRRFGDMWTITFSGTTTQLRATRGLQYLARLLAQPLRELHATDRTGYFCSYTPDPPIEWEV